MYNWTDEQLEAINTVGAPIIVSAAAGSGKTAVLVERTVRLLCDEKLAVPADALLAVTFTNDAAAQMSRKLTQEIDLRAASEPDNDWIQRQQALLRLAEITTINAFCYNTVKDNLSETDFQSGVRILEENEAAMLTDRALTTVLEREYAERPAETEELISLFCRENDANLRRMILQIYGFLRSLPFSEHWVRTTLKRLRDGAASAELLNDLDESSNELVGLILSAISRLRAVCEALEYHSAAREILLFNCDVAEAAAETVRICKREEIAPLCKNLVWKPLTGARQTKSERQSASELEAGLYESAKNCYNHLKDLFEELADSGCYTEETVAEDAEKVADYFEKLVRICRLLEEETHRMKVERNAVDFADTELMTVSLLTACDENGVVRRTPLAEEIVASKRYKVILIDEFQDVNNLQEVIFKAISDTDDLSQIGKNVFVVGDVKQAIYRFRQANPRIFMRTRALGKSPESPVRELLLRKNFRSRQSILSFCNYVFGALMSDRMGETDYTDDEALVCGSDFGSADSPVEVIVYDSDCDDTALDIELTAAARKIRQLIDIRAEVKDGDAYRPCRPSDFCVLTRNNIDGSKIAPIFEKEGLKILSSDTSGYLRSREISVLLNLLAAISNPMQDIPLASVMLSPIMGFSDDDVANLRILSRDSKLYKIILGVANGDYTAPEPLKEKCTAAVGLLKKLSVLASGSTLTRLIRQIYDLTDIFALASSYEDGAQKCANLYLLLEYARSYEQSSPDGVAGFLRYIDYISSSGGDFEQALTVTESAEAVVIKTVHRSKGLEYPFVFLLQTEKRFNLSDISRNVQLSEERGVGLSFLDYETLTKRPTAFWGQVRNDAKSKLLSEELRLLYVAMTRAKERLFILLDIGESAIKRAVKFSYEIDGYRVAPAVAQKAVCTADWLMMALMKHPDFEALRSKLDAGTYCDTENLPPLKVSAMPESVYREEAAAPSVEAADASLADDLVKSFSVSTSGRLTENEAKLTVSEIVKDDALTFFPRVPSLDESLEEFTAAQKGTITHKFMQFCDLSLAMADLDREIMRLVSLNILTRREAEAVNRESVLRFFESDICRRMKQSPNVLREKRFIVRFDDISVGKTLEDIYKGTDGMLQGVADCLFEEDDGFVLVDYKTDRVSSLSELSERYSGQLELYKAAFDVLLDKPVKSSYIYSFRLGEGIEVGL